MRKPLNRVAVNGSPGTPPLPVEDSARRRDPSAFTLRYSRRLRSCRLPGAFISSPLPPIIGFDLMCSKVPSLHGRYPASSLLRTWPPPFRLRATSRLCRLYDRAAPPISRWDEDGFSSCLACPCHRAVPTTPPEGCASSDSLATHPVAFVRHEKTRPLGSIFLSGPPMGSLVLRPGDSLTILKMALSVSFIRLVSSTNVTQATGR